jgi:hypothetical protein
MNGALDNTPRSFLGHFEILKNYCVVRERDIFLAPQIEEDLFEYSRDELTCIAYGIVARKIARQ